MGRGARHAACDRAAAAARPDLPPWSVRRSAGSSGARIRDRCAGRGRRQTPGRRADDRRRRRRRAQIRPGGAGCRAADRARLADRRPQRRPQHRRAEAGAAGGRRRARRELRARHARGRGRGLRADPRRWSARGSRHHREWIPQGPIATARSRGYSPKREYPGKSAARRGRPQSLFRVRVGRRFRPPAPPADVEGKPSSQTGAIASKSAAGGQGARGSRRSLRKTRRSGTCGWRCFRSPTSATPNGFASGTRTGCCGARRSAG
jgi:hypothetical protein